MKVFVQQVNTGKFLTRSMGWASSEADAMDFASSVEAIECVLGNQLRGTQILIRMDWDSIHPSESIPKTSESEDQKNRNSKSEKKQLRP